MSHITRRSMLSTVAAAIPAAALPRVSAAAQPTASDAEILAAIEAHRRAFNAPQWQEHLSDAEADALGDVMREAEEALLSLRPATPAGAIAVLRYARELADTHEFPLFEIEDGNDIAYSLLDWAERAIRAIARN